MNWSNHGKFVSFHFNYFHAIKEVKLKLLLVPVITLYNEAQKLNQSIHRLPRCLIRVIRCIWMNFENFAEDCIVERKNGTYFVFIYLLLYSRMIKIFVTVVRIVMNKRKKRKLHCCNPFEQLFVKKKRKEKKEHAKQKRKMNNCTI